MPTRVPASTVSISPVQPADVPAVVALVRTVLAEFDLSFGEGAATDDQLASLPGSYVEHGGAFWVAVDADAKLLGTAGVFPLDPGVFELRKMYLDPAARGRGVGQRLLDESLAWARAQGGRRMVLDTTDKMTSAIRFYEANGFIRDDSQKRAARCSRGYAKELEGP
jgi:putative acetyltransferase